MKLTMSKKPDHAILQVDAKYLNRDQSETLDLTFESVIDSATTMKSLTKTSLDKWLNVR